MEGLNKEGWVSVYKSTDGMDVNLLHGKLESMGIDAIIFNHQDSMLTSLNDTNYSVSLYVHENDVEKVKEIIQSR